MDDGSTDGSSAVAHEFAECDARVSVLRQTKVGQPNARNLGMARASGTWIAAADSDDYWHPRRLERQLVFLQEHPSVGVLGAYGYRISSTGRRLGVFDLGPTSVEEFHKLRQRGTPFGMIHPAILMRRELVEQVKGYPCDYPVGTDLALFNLRIAPLTNIVALPERLVFVEIRPDSSMKRMVDHAYDVYEVVALNLRRQKRGVPVLGYSEGLQAIGNASPLTRFAGHRRRWRNRWYTLGAAAIAAGSPLGLVRLALAFLIGPVYTCRKLWSQVAALLIERIVSRVDEPR